MQWLRQQSHSRLYYQHRSADMSWMCYKVEPDFRPTVSFNDKFRSMDQNKNKDGHPRMRYLPLQFQRSIVSYRHSLSLSFGCRRQAQCPGWAFLTWDLPLQFQRSTVKGQSSINHHSFSRSFFRLQAQSTVSPIIIPSRARSSSALSKVKGHVSISIILCIVKGLWSISITLSLFLLTAGAKYSVPYEHPLAGEIFLCNVKGHVSISIILYIVKGQWSIIITLSLSFSQLQAPSTVSPMNIPLAVNKHYPLHCQKSKVNYHHSFSQLQAPPSTVSPMNIPLAGKIFLCNVKGQRSCVNKHYPLHYQRSTVNYHHSFSLSFDCRRQAQCPLWTSPSRARSSLPSCWWPSSRSRSSGTPWCASPSRGQGHSGRR